MTLMVNCYGCGHAYDVADRDHRRRHATHVADADLRPDQLLGIIDLLAADRDRYALALVHAADPGPVTVAPAPDGEYPIDVYGTATPTISGTSVSYPIGQEPGR